MNMLAHQSPHTDADAPGAASLNGPAADERAETVVRPLPAVALVHPSPVDTPASPSFPPHAQVDIETYIQAMDGNKVLLIPVGVVIKSDLDTNGNAAVIAGRVEGNIDAGNMPVIVKEGGSVAGTIKSENVVVVAGTVDAAADGYAIVTKGLWMLAETGQVKGSVAYGRHRGYEGGRFSGLAMPFEEYKA